VAIDMDNGVASFFRNGKKMTGGVVAGLPVKEPLHLVVSGGAIGAVVELKPRKLLVGTKKSQQRSWQTQGKRRRRKLRRARQTRQIWAAD
jgi:hypothetical protein